MSSYPNWWNSTITIYNRYEDPLTQLVVWYRTVLTNCFWKINTEVSLSNSGINKTHTNTIICRIPKNSKFLNAYNWKKLSSDKMATKFTLQVGDIIVKGKVTDNIDEYTKGSHSSDLLEKYKDLGILKISTVADNSDDSRNLAHYCAMQEL